MRCRSGNPKGDLEVVRISRDGTSLTLEDKDAMEYRAIDPADCEVVKKGGQPPQPQTPAPPPPAAQPGPAATAPPPPVDRRRDDDFDRPRQPAPTGAGDSARRRD